jgi:broad specificity phosphatase PhoE
MRLLLLRHGQTYANTSGALDTAVPGLHLTELGVRQAEAAARALAADGIDGIYVSNLTRTHQTAAPLAELLGISPRVLEGLREISAGDFEMGTDHDSIAGSNTPVPARLEPRYDTRKPGGESGHEFPARYDAAVAEIAGAGHGRAVLVSHGAAIRTWISARVPGIESHAKATDPLHNTACIELDGDPIAGWQVHVWHSNPVGGAFLDDETAPDPTGQATDEAADQATGGADPEN